MESSQHQKHFVLVHGACHGAWCWYKLKPLLEAAGHKVTALDLSASGINSAQITDIGTIHDYSSPLLHLLNSISGDDKVILVGHSLGGLNIAVAMDKFPEKISVGVFLAAFMPDPEHAPSFVLEKFKERNATDYFMDTRFYPNEGYKPLTVMFFGSKFLTDKVYQCCHVEDLELAKMLVRPSSMFIESLSECEKLTEEGYGSVNKVYIVCGQDLAIPEKFQRWVIENGKVIKVMEIKEADHMPMLSLPEDVCQCLLNVADNYYN